MYLLGIDVGSSSVKVAIYNTIANVSVGEAFSPKVELKINAPQPGFAEQNPETWWEHFKTAYHELIERYAIHPHLIKAIGISYQMHGLVVIDKEGKVLHDAIIWCDSRAVTIGEQAYQDNRAYCETNLLNSPANLTLSKLFWLKTNKPQIYAKIHKFMLPGDYIAFKLSGEITTTLCGLSEMIAWDYKSNQISKPILGYFGIDESLLPQVVATFTDVLTIKPGVAKELNLNTQVKISYRAGDQPNNALGLNVLNPREMAINAGTSGVLYGVLDKPLPFDKRNNQIIHVNHNFKNQETRLGLLMCINGVGILNSWLKNKLFAKTNLDYQQMNQLASQVSPGSSGLTIIPFGNGAERMLDNKMSGANIFNLDLNLHDQAHFIRAATEGIAYAFHYAISIVRELGVAVDTLKAGHTNMFLSPIFRDTLASLSQVDIELYNSSGAVAAALGAGIGINAYNNFAEALSGLNKELLVTPNNLACAKPALDAGYMHWLDKLTMSIMPNLSTS
jgi:xylulokinase